jgi:hypothetical protein
MNAVESRNPRHDYARRHAMRSRGCGLLTVTRVLPGMRPYTNWQLQAPCDPGNLADMWAESASTSIILEHIGALAEVQSVGRALFSGPLRTKNRLWAEYRNLLRQAMSNYAASLTVPNRSAGLLQYYALLNFAKAELLVMHPATILGARVGHGLSFSPTAARTVVGDHLVVQAGVFRLLYEARTGHPLPIGTRLSVKRLIQQVPEIGTQAGTFGISDGQVHGAFHMLAWDEVQSWSLLAIAERGMQINRPTQKLVSKHFHQVSSYPDAPNHFGLSRRWSFPLQVLESNETVPHGPLGDIDLNGAMGLTWALRDVLGMRTVENYDVFIAPSLLKSKMFPMPPSLARYALAFYTSSLVRYRPAMFDAQSFPDQAYLFDAVTREISLPILMDTFAALRGRDQHFFAADTFRA